ncbi:hypothetical protein CLV84_0084 [Neolewinella xylanilytica]|uniref:NrtR DNA-binding winged helix domain-containing protein n=1 Tax=Neolewinella xylanilytica TaxID=1514080 RepID=A0A2S6I6Q2_9BACT|nr:NUDIX hydrolase [Neolewinella xylanilytica]PPK87150.1 hypothetical protein CLV84_0084 [Neolewinella xylanilytica]
MLTDSTAANTETSGQPRLERLRQGQNFIQQLSIDCVIVGYEANKLKVLVPNLDVGEDLFALPSGFIRQEEGIEGAARRIIADRTGITDFYLHQFGVYGTAGRTNRPYFDRLIGGALERQGLDPGVTDELQWITRRFVSIGYYALVDLTTVSPTKTPVDTAIEWTEVNALPTLIMDHNEMIADALATIRLQFDEGRLAFYLLPAQFTMKEVKKLYETVFQRPFARNNFQKKILDLDALERVSKKFTGASHRAPYLYRFPRRWGEY